jgi:hypothetical protein
MRFADGLAALDAMAHPRRDAVARPVVLTHDAMPAHQLDVAEVRLGAAAPALLAMVDDEGREPIVYDHDVGDARRTEGVVADVVPVASASRRSRPAPSGTQPT